MPTPALLALALTLLPALTRAAPPADPAPAPTAAPTTTPTDAPPADPATTPPAAPAASPAAPPPRAIPPEWRCDPTAPPTDRPPRPCIDPLTDRVRLPPMAWHPKYTQLAPADRPTAQALAALLTATPAIARLRVEVHDYRDPYAGHYGKCRPCARAAALADAITRHGIDPARITHAGHHLDRLPHDRPREAALAPGPKRYEVHIERWHHPP